ncbi:MarR family transcriptional regulator [Pseudogemmatithrix spongiicola]|uniref:MarR family transcriptional regulator n=1 Tax=Pseudogemmatithrix spongiicola TaxID=3062599 RepID=A0AA49Q5M9_9BACT|nr:MarR family transcriptional regulator [Gemmatimonadaceae bacterium 'strain 138']WKW16315.1 MarR family transcriptional regulator [Gemmatimonadaceae bacterium 'strain 318']
MSPDLRHELRQQKPFASLAQEAFLSVARTETVLREGIERLLEPYDLTLTQYNVLRVLRGADSTGLCRNEIRDRLVTRMPDVTRLLDRMEDAGLIHRVRSTEDRRQVNTTLTPKGRKLVNELDAPMAKVHEQQLGHLDAKQLKTLIDLLALARN